MILWIKENVVFEFFFGNLIWEIWKGLYKKNSIVIFNREEDFVLFFMSIFILLFFLDWG